MNVGRVIYPDASNGYPLIDAEILGHLESAEMSIEIIKKRNTSDAAPITVSDLFIFMLLQHACFRKNASFRSENEYRVVVDTLEPRYDLLRYRTTRSCMIPFLELAIPRYEEGHDKDPNDSLLSNPMGGHYQFIKRAVIGPTPNMNLTLETVKAFFRTKRLQVDVVPSSVSFRDW
jgi:hypothetical protein